ncbi:hypothetical protein CDCA_CDCA12G3535 [Cyanidium caldarium]|uniref:C2 NT-type domain-containing protein n=1 Tax=Cyanidium caldarium TaxID=2771 RepID=A0AAV9IZM1_CYACA|nr:hypothetical protein CDCA_CDCA12G3535 [Cyanidium caldarium]
MARAPSRLHKERQHFQLDVTVTRVVNAPRGRTLAVQLQRGVRASSSAPFRAPDRGSPQNATSVNETLSVLCTLYRPKGSGSFDAKDAKLRLVAADRLGGGSGAARTPILASKALAKVHFNVVDFLGELGSGISLAHTFALSGGVQIEAQVRLSWLGPSASAHGGSTSSYGGSELSELSVQSSVWSDSEAEAEVPTPPAVTAAAVDEGVAVVATAASAQVAMPGTVVEEASDVAAKAPVVNAEMTPDLSLHPLLVRLRRENTQLRQELWKAEQQSKHFLELADRTQAKHEEASQAAQVIAGALQSTAAMVRLATDEEGAGAGGTVLATATRQTCSIPDLRMLAHVDALQAVVQPWSQLSTAVAHLVESVARSVSLARQWHRQVQALGRWLAAPESGFTAEPPPAIALTLESADGLGSDAGRAAAVGSLVPAGASVLERQMQCVAQLLQHGRRCLAQLHSSLSEMRDEIRAMRTEQLDVGRRNVQQTRDQFTVEWQALRASVLAALAASSSRSDVGERHLPGARMQRHALMTLLQAVRIQHDQVHCLKTVAVEQHQTTAAQLTELGQCLQTIRERENKSPQPTAGDTASASPVITAAAWSSLQACHQRAQALRRLHTQLRATAEHAMKDAQQQAATLRKQITDGVAASTAQTAAHGQRAHDAVLAESQTQRQALMRATAENGDLLQQLIAAKMAAAESVEREEILRRDFRRQQRRDHEKIARLGKALTKLELRLARTRPQRRAAKQAAQQRSRDERNGYEFSGTVT